MPLAPHFVIRPARLDDLESLLALEQSAFPQHRQSSRRSLGNSIKSDHQRVVVVEDKINQRLCGAMICFIYPKTLRIYSIAVDSDRRGEGLGGSLLNEAREIACGLGLAQLSLEVDATDVSLRSWYAHRGFVQGNRIADYYEVGEDALKMSCELPSHSSKSKVKTLVITFHPKLWKTKLDHVQALSPKAYLSDPAWQKREGLRVINLCAPYRDDRLGYYTSLLGVARNHRVIPNVIMIKDLNRPRLSDLFSYEAEQALQRLLAQITEDKLELLVFFERPADPRFVALAKLLSRFIEVPLFRVTLERSTLGSHIKELPRGVWRVKRVKPLTLVQASRLDPKTLEEAAPVYLNKQRFHKHGIKHERYDLAILIDPNEATPPSCPEALDRLRIAAESIGFYVELITAEEAHRVAEFDALLIRATTRVNHPTYKISRLATTEGLVVIDDPWSILKCSNKVYLYERLTRARIRQPKSWVFLSGGQVNLQLLDLSFPLVLKHPEGSFSKGVFKVDRPEELEAQLEILFEETDLIIGQEFLQSDFDWRIGVINHQPLFACRYYKASGHWQIYNWSSEDQEEITGRSDTVPLAEVSKLVLSTAIRAASLMGDGLYGVDLKEKNGVVYVIEVNDNPNIDAGIEDAVEGDALYRKIAMTMMNKIEKERALEPNTQLDFQDKHGVKS